jgi:two-component system, OmpR family, sensor kinase
MAATSQSSGFWQSVRQLPGRTPLRTKLITAVLALVAIALAVISVAGLSFLRSYLLGAADDQLYAAAHQSRPAAAAYSPEGFVTAIVQNGKIVYSHGYAPPGLAGPEITPGASWLISGDPTTVPSSNGAGQWRVLADPNQTLYNQFGQSLGTGTVVFGINVTPQYTTIGKLVVVDVLVSAVIVLLLAMVATAVVRRSLRPLTDIEKTAGAIAAGDLTQRVPEGDPRTEMGRLGRSLNVMLGHIETAFRARSQSEAAARRSEERMRQFVADASHELRTPLTAIRGFAEYYRQRGGVVQDPDQANGSATDAAAAMTALNGTNQLSPADLARIMRRVEQESARMGVLVEDMLLLARLDQQRPLERSTVDLLALAADAVHDARVVAPNRNINLTVGAGAALLVNGDEVRLRQVIGNLMSNALAHTPDGTDVDVLIRSGSLGEIHGATGAAGSTGYSSGGADDQPMAVLDVTDYGPGLTEEQAAHAFERFYRADQARTVGGTGLGLAIVAALVAAHGGAVWVRSDHGHGATFSIALPLAPEAIHEADDGDRLDDDAEVLDFEAGDDPAAYDHELPQNEKASASWDRPESTEDDHPEAEARRDSQTEARRDSQTEARRDSQTDARRDSETENHRGSETKTGRDSAAASSWTEYGRD